MLTADKIQIILSLRGSSNASFVGEFDIGIRYFIRLTALKARCLYLGSCFTEIRRFEGIEPGLARSRSGFDVIDDVIFHCHTPCNDWIPHQLTN